MWRSEIQAGAYPEGARSRRNAEIARRRLDDRIQIMLVEQVLAPQRDAVGAVPRLPAERRTDQVEGRLADPVVRGEEIPAVVAIVRRQLHRAHGRIDPIDAPDVGRDERGLDRPVAPGLAGEFLVP